MIPWSFHVSPKGEPTLLMTWTAPVLGSALFNLAPEENPISRLSADQNGYSAFSVPDICWKEPLARFLTHSAVAPSSPAATKATRRPSGEIARLYGTKDVDWGGCLETERLSLRRRRLYPTRETQPGKQREEGRCDTPRDPSQPPRRGPHFFCDFACVSGPHPSLFEGRGLSASARPDPWRGSEAQHAPPEVESLAEEL